MTKQDIIDTVYRSKEYDDCIRNICKDRPHFFDDLKQDIYIDLLNKSESLIQDLFSAGKLKFYFIRMLYNQVNSNSSNFYRKYRQKEIKYEHTDFYNDAVDVLEADEEVQHNTFDILQYVIEHKLLDWADSELFNLYYRMNPSYLEEDISVKVSYEKIAEKLSLSKHSIYVQMNRIRTKIFNHIINNTELSNSIPFDNLLVMSEFVEKHSVQLKQNKEKYI